LRGGKRPPNLFRLIVSQLPILRVSAFYVQQFKSFILGKSALAELLQWGRSSFKRTPKFGQNTCLTDKFLHCEFYLFMFSSSKVSFFWGRIFGKSFWGVPRPEDPQNLVRVIGSQTTYYIVSFNLLPPPWRNPKFFPNNCLTNNFLHCKFQLSMFSSSKVLF